MKQKIYLPQILPEIKDHQKQHKLHFYAQFITETMYDLLPKGVFDLPTEKEPFKEQYDRLKELLPLIHSTEIRKAPSEFSVFLLCRFRKNAFRFYFEMVSKWLYPTRNLNVVLINGIDFRMPEVSDDLLTICECVMRVDTEEERAEILKNLPIIEKEIRLGAASQYQARRILEIKGLAVDEKTSLIHEYISDLIKKRPKDFQSDIFDDVQHMLVVCPEDFKNKRSYSHISRIICLSYLFRKHITHWVVQIPHKRHMNMKLSKWRVTKNGEQTPSLAMMVGMNFLGKNELFEEEHLLKAIRNYLPNVRPIEGSFLRYTDQRKPIGTFYLEIEKVDQSEFTSEEIRTLRRELPSDLKGRIEHLMHPVFMPRNDEELMKNVLILSKQLKYVRDLPQVVISFDDQNENNLEFTIIALRILNKKSGSLLHLLRNEKEIAKVTVNQCKPVGFIHNKYVKEANIMHIELPKFEFLREDYTIDLFKARQKVVKVLENVLGEFRDYNGGMISKQNEAFGNLRDNLKDEIKSYEFLLENFFFSIQPAIMRTVLKTPLLRTFFSLLLDAMDECFFKGEGDSLQVKMDEEASYAVVTSDDLKIKERIDEKIQEFQLTPYETASIFVHVYETPCFGYLLRSQDQKLKEQFIQVIRQIMRESRQKQQLLTTTNS